MVTIALRDLEESIDFWEHRAASNIADHEAIRGEGKPFEKLPIFSRYSGKTVLDIACGYGRHSIPLAQEGRTVVGLDSSKSMLSRYQKNMKEKNLTNIDIVLASMTALPFKDHSFSLLFCFGSFCLLPKKYWKDIISEFKRVGNCSLVEFFNLFNCGNLLHKTKYFLCKIYGKPFPNRFLSLPTKFTFVQSYIQSV